MPMELNIDKLLSTLSALSVDELNAILEIRDADPFDSTWCKLNESVGGSETHPNAHDIFVRISKTTEQHEITSYIADDLDLIHRAEQKGIEDPFLQYLKSCYAEGVVPSKWDDV